MGRDWNRSSPWEDLTTIHNRWSLIIGLVGRNKWFNLWVLLQLLLLMFFLGSFSMIRSCSILAQDLVICSLFDEPGSFQLFLGLSVNGQAHIPPHSIGGVRHVISMACSFCSRSWIWAQRSRRPRGSRAWSKRWRLVLWPGGRWSSTQPLRDPHAQVLGFCGSDRGSGRQLDHRGWQPGWEARLSLPDLVGLGNYGQCGQLNQRSDWARSGHASFGRVPLGSVRQLHLGWHQGGLGHLDREWHGPHLWQLGSTDCRCSWAPSVHAVQLADAPRRVSELRGSQGVQWQRDPLPLDPQRIPGRHRSHGPAAVRGWVPDQGGAQGQPKALGCGCSVRGMEGVSSILRMWRSHLLHWTQRSSCGRGLSSSQVRTSGHCTRHGGRLWQWCRSHRVQVPGCQQPDGPQVLEDFGTRDMAHSLPHLWSHTGSDDHLRSESTGEGRRTRTNGTVRPIGCSSPGMVEFLGGSRRIRGGQLCGLCGRSGWEELPPAEQGEAQKTPAGGGRSASSGRDASPSWGSSTSSHRATSSDGRSMGSRATGGSTGWSDRWRFGLCRSTCWIGAGDKGLWSSGRERHAWSCRRSCKRCGSYGPQVCKIHCGSDSKCVRPGDGRDLTIRPRPPSKRSTHQLREDPEGHRRFPCQHRILRSQWLQGLAARQQRRLQHLLDLLLSLLVRRLTRSRWSLRQAPRRGWKMFEKRSSSRQRPAGFLSQRRF